METMQIDSTATTPQKTFNTPHSASSLVDHCTPIKKRKNYSNTNTDNTSRMSSSSSSVEPSVSCDTACDSNVSTLSSGHNNDVDHEDGLIHNSSITSPIPHFEVGSLIRGGMRRDIEEDHLLLEQVEGALDSPLKVSGSTPLPPAMMDLISTTSDNLSCSNTPPRRKRSFDDKQDVPEWRKKEDPTTRVTSDEFSAFSTNSATGGTPQKSSTTSGNSSTTNTTRSRNGSFSTTPQHGSRSSWFRNVTPNKPSPVSSDSASTDCSTPTRDKDMTGNKTTGTYQTTSTNSSSGSPFKEMRNANFTFQKFAPHALHVHCSLMKSKAPTVYMSNESKTDTDGRINYTFECGLSCISRENTIMSASGKHHNKTHAKAIAARRLLMDLYPEFKGSLELIIKHLDRELQEKKLNLRRILPNDNELTKQQQQIKMANNHLLKEGFNSMDTTSDSGSPPQEVVNNKPQQQQQPPAKPNQYTFYHVPFEEAIKVLNELIHIKGYNYPNCQHKEVEENGQVVHQVTMILEMPNDKGVYYSEGKGYDVKFAKGECSWKMLCYLFPNYNSNWYLIRDYVEDLRSKRKVEKLKKREEVLAVRRKLDFTSNPADQSEDSRPTMVDNHYEQEHQGKMVEEVLLSKQMQVPPPPPPPPSHDMIGGPNWYQYSNTPNNMHNVNPMNMYHPQPQFMPYSSPPMNSHSMIFPNNMMNHPPHHPYWYHPYQNHHSHCYCNSCMASNSVPPPNPYFSTHQHSLFSQSFQNSSAEPAAEYRPQKH